jgi:hypothetical protein
MILTIDTDALKQALFIAAQAYTYLGGVTFLIVCITICIRWEEDIAKRLVSECWFKVMLICVFVFPVVLWWLFTSVIAPLVIRKLKRVKRVYL